MKEGVIRLDMDIKVIEQLVEQALKEIKAEQPLKFTAPKLERYGVFKTMDEAIAASEEAKKLLFSKFQTDKICGCDPVNHNQERES